MPQTESPEITLWNPIELLILCFGAVLISYEWYKDIGNGFLANLHCGYDSVVLCWIKTQAYPLLYPLMLLLFIFAIFESSRVICVSNQKIKVRWAFGVVTNEWRFSEISSAEIKSTFGKYGRITFLEIKFDKKPRIFKFYERSKLQVVSTVRGYNEFLRYLHRNNVRIAYER